MKPSMISIKCITFDVTNTLLKVRGGVGWMYKFVDNSQSTSILLDATAEVIERNFRHVFAETWRRHPNFGHTSCGADVWWKRVTMRTVSRTLSSTDMCCTYREQFYEALHAEFEKASSYELVEGVPECLHHLKSVGYRLGTLTNNDPRIRSILEQFSLSSLFEIQLISYEQGVAKPDCEIFDRARRTFQTSGREILHVGDSLELDYLPARNAGFHSILRKGGSGLLDPNGHRVQTVSDISSLPSYLMDS